MISTITLGGNTINVVALPVSPGPDTVEFFFEDIVAEVDYPWTGQTQTQVIPGAEKFTGTVTMPKLSQAHADDWISALMECRGILNGFMIGDPAKPRPRGRVGRSAPVTAILPVVSGSTILLNGLAPGTTALQTTGWEASGTRLLLPGDYLQIGVRLYRNLDIVNADATGAATLSIWPSLRENPGSGTPLTLSNPQGLFRLSTNKRTWSSDWSRLTNLSFQIREYR